MTLTQHEVPTTQTVPMSRFADQSADPITSLTKIADDAEAKRVSHAIDETLKKDAVQWKKKQKAITMLLLGQSGAGKSTILRQFRIKYAAKQFTEERAEWIPIIYLQVVKYLRRLIELLEADKRAVSVDAEKKFRIRKFKLAPLLELERSLREALGSVVSLSGPTHSDNAFSTPKLASSDHDVQEDVVLFNGWQDKLRNRPFGKGYSGPLSPPMNSAVNNESTPHLMPGVKDDVETAQIMSGCEDDINALLTEAKDRDILASVEGQYFLKRVGKISKSNYIPDEEDILNSRVRTMGITETLFKDDKAQMFRIIDTGGSKGQRPSWVPFFEQASALIFLAPVSAFNENLKEDSEINCLQDSLDTFRLILNNDLLKNVSIILFLNKVDLLQKKLQSGVQVSHTFPAFSGPNDLRSTLEWVKGQFNDIFLKSTSTQSRGFYPYNTTATDTKATQKTLDAVKDSILAAHLVKAGIM